MKRFQNIFLALLIATSLFGCANDLSLTGMTAQDAFKSKGVVELMAVVKRRDVSKARHLIENGVDVNAVGKGGSTPLIWFEMQRDTDAMQLLLDLGADPNKHVAPGVGEVGFGPPLWMAAGAGQKKIMKLLLDHRADPNLAMGGESPLMMAIAGPHLDCAELLLQYGADINYAEGENGVSAFDEGMVILQYDVVLWVLNHGYTHNLPRAKRMLTRERRKTRPGQEAMKEQALEIIDRRIAEQQKQ